METIERQTAVQRINELRTQPHVFFNDPGHGWLEVERKDLDILGIADKISGFSYQKAEINPNTGKEEVIVYLEEDCDAPLYMNTLWANCLNSPAFEVWKNMLKDEYRERIFIRNLNHYQA